MTTPETQGVSVDEHNPPTVHERPSGPGDRERLASVPSNALVALDRFNIPLLLGAVVGLLVLLIGYWTENRYLVLAGGFGVLAMAMSWVLIAWLAMTRTFVRWLSSRRSPRDKR